MLAGDSTVILSTDSDIFQYLKRIEPKPGAPALPACRDREFGHHHLRGAPFLAGRSVRRRVTRHEATGAGLEADLLPPVIPCPCGVSFPFPVGAGLPNLPLMNPVSPTAAIS